MNEKIYHIFDKWRNYGKYIYIKIIKMKIETGLYGFKNSKRQLVYILYHI